MKNLTMKKLLFLLVLVFSSQTAFSWCLLKKYGNTCEKPALSKVRQWWKDKVNLDPEYRTLFVGITAEGYSVPYQPAETSTEITENRSYHAEFALNDKFSVKAQKMDLSFNSFTDGYQFNHEHLFGLLMVRLYFLDSWVLRGGAGVGQANISVVEEKEVENKDPIYEEKERYSTNTVVMQASLAYFFPEENVTMGMVTTSISGTDSERNYGATSYGFMFQLGFL